VLLYREFPLTIFIMVLIIHEVNVQSYLRLLQGTNSSAFENVLQFLTKYLLKFLCKLGEYGPSCLPLLLAVLQEVSSNFEIKFSKWLIILLMKLLI